MRSLLLRIVVLLHNSVARFRPQLRDLAVRLRDAEHAAVQHAYDRRLDLRAELEAEAEALLQQARSLRAGALAELYDGHNEADYLFSQLRRG